MIKNPKAPYGASLGRLENKAHQAFGKISQPFSEPNIKPKETVSGQSTHAPNVTKPKNPLSTTMRGIKNG